MATARRRHLLRQAVVVSPLCFRSLVPSSLVQPFLRPLNLAASRVDGSSTVSFRHTLLAAALVGGVLVSAPPARGAETWTLADRRYERVRVLEVTAATVTIAHVGGMAQLDLAALSPELQARFGYEPGKASAWQAEAGAGLAATTERARQVEVEKQRRATEASNQQRVAAIRTGHTRLAPVELREEVDLRPVFARNRLYSKSQGMRPSCSIFAVISALEYDHVRSTGTPEAFSEEYLIWGFQQIFPGRPINDGYNFNEVLQVIRKHGVARRSLLPDSFASYLSDNDPPQDAVDDAASRTSYSVHAFDPEDEDLLSQLAGALNRELPVIVGLRWPPPSTIERNNLLRDQVPQSDAAHAVTLVGYRSQGSPESLVFIFRNSYGPQWGLGGYGLIAAPYLRKYLLTAFCLRFVPPG